MAINFTTILHEAQKQVSKCKKNKLNEQSAIHFHTDFFSQTYTKYRHKSENVCSEVCSNPRTKVAIQQQNKITKFHCNIKFLLNMLHDTKCLATCTYKEWIQSLSMLKVPNLSLTMCPLHFNR